MRAEVAVKMTERAEATAAQATAAAVSPGACKQSASTPRSAMCALIVLSANVYYARHACIDWP